VQLEVLDWATYFDNSSSGKFQLSAFGYSSRLDAALRCETFVCDKFDPSFFWDDGGDQDGKCLARTRRNGLVVGSAAGFDRSTSRFGTIGKRQPRRAPD
jgi:hypothetical protein